jgi:murein DD-endopeptidase MepM/ murein hydrolase activator NlpD
MKHALPILMALMLTGCATSPHMATVPMPAQKPVMPGIQVPSGIPSARGYVWPVQGIVVSEYGDNVNRVINKGIDIKVPEGSAVRASRDGKVVYCDPLLKGFGKTVIIDHGGGYQTVYAYNSEISVRVGEAVMSGQVIAKSGSTGRAGAPSLHFEVRKNGEPQNPRQYLR